MRDLLNHVQATALSTYSAVVFAACFIALVLWVLSPARKSSYQKAAQLPLDE
jgi:cbb3-type cytochrome oxidase subunit 3